jgi:16S rRNA (guanine527-N7)-methyltransferase
MAAELPAAAAARLHDLGERYALDSGRLRALAGLLELLAASEHAPTSVRDPVAGADVHIADSLVALELGLLAPSSAVADVGAGAGFPGLALAIAVPGAHISLIESNERKCAFIQGAIEHVRLGNAEVVHARAEEWVQGAQANDLVLARALAPQPVVLEYAAPLLRVGGSLIDWRGRRDGGEEAEASAAAQVLGMRVQEIRAVVPFAGSRDRHIHVFCKVSATPERFPRRAGVARKRPLG